MAAGSLATASSDLFPPSFMRGTGRRKTKSTCQQYSGPLEEDAAGRWSKARGVDSEARLLTACGRSPSSASSSALHILSDQRQREILMGA
ncbi:uncharacterized protein LOC106998107 isoform X4 [Macaca mulatta]